MSSSTIALPMKDLWKQVSKGGGDTTDLETCTDLLKSVYRQLCETASMKKKNSIQIKNADTFATYIKTLDAAQKTFRANKRSADNDIEKLQWDEALKLTKQIGRTIVAMEEKFKESGGADSDGLEEDSGAAGAKEGLPSSVSAYQSRFKQQRKELYKSPPVLPPAQVIVEEEYMPAPKRDKNTLRLKFQPSQNQWDSDKKTVKQLFQDFQPNQTPAEVLQGGAFGGTYFRPIISAVTNQKYNASKVLETSVQPEWIQGLDTKTMLTSVTYREHVNRYGVKCGGSLDMWESSGWISDADPYGWFQWYCRFYQGRRSSDDIRQIKRWMGVAGPKGRFKSQLCNKILAACPKGTQINNKSISPVIRQTLFHWGLLITKEVLEEHQKRKK